MRMGWPCLTSWGLALLLAIDMTMRHASAYSMQSISNQQIRRQCHTITRLQSSNGGSDDIARKGNLPTAVSKEGTDRARRKLFVFGLGYVGTKVAVQLRDRGWEVCGTCQDEKGVLSFKAKTGITAYPFDARQGKITNRTALANLKTASHVLVTIPPGYNGKDAVAHLHGRDMQGEARTDRFDNYISQNALSSTRVGTADGEERSSPDVDMTDATILSKQWVGYLSSTGVYGDCQGSWVAESQPVAPFSEKAKARVNAEGQWINEYVRYGLPVHIFRLAGIYGPERSALDVLREASGDMSKCKPDDQSLVSRIHVDDIVQVLTSSMSRPTPGLIVNVADDRPATRYEVLSYCCKLLKYPVQAPAQLRSVGQRSVGLTRGGSKRVDNSLMISLLRAQGKKLMYPDFSAGLKGLLQDEEEERGKQKRAEGASSIATNTSLEVINKSDSKTFDVDKNDDDDDGYNLLDTGDGDQPNDDDVVSYNDVEVLADPTTAITLEEKVDDLIRRLVKVEQALANLQEG